MKSHYEKDFMQGQDGNRHTAHALEQLRKSDPEKYQEYMRLKMQQQWEATTGVSTPMPAEMAKAAEESVKDAAPKKPRRKREPKIAEQIKNSLLGLQS